MNQDEARQFVVENVVVARHQVIVMKSLLLKHYSTNSANMLEAALSDVGASKPSLVTLHATVDPIPTLKQFAGWISWAIAGCEAVWGLMRSGVFLPAASDLNFVHPKVGWTTVVPGSGGHSSGWDFPEFKVSYPHWLSRSRATSSSEVLCDPDLFLHELSLPGLHHEVEEALREAVSCLRSELYTAAVVMLGKASEGSWIEMGIALLTALPDEDANRRDKLRQEWSGPDVGIARKMRDIMKLYETRQDVFKTIGVRADVRLDDLRMAMIWSESIRDARNVVHHSVDPNINPTFEMISTLFMAALSHLKALHRIAAEARG